jgi:hypothetical protein
LNAGAASRTLSMNPYTSRAKAANPSFAASALDSCP